MRTPKVDVLLTYWGDFELLKKAVESVISQTYLDWRLVVIDDCYPSDEAERYFATVTDPRITYYRHEKNIGITHNFNYAVDQASAEFSILLGCDDKLLPNYLERALEQIKNADFYQPGVEVINEEDVIYSPLVDKIKRFLRPKRNGMYSGEKLATSLSRGNWLYFPSILWKTSVLKKYRFNTAYTIVEDVELEFNLIADGGVLALDDAVTFQYRRSANSLSSKEKTGVRFNEEDDVYDKFAEKFKALGWNRAAKSARLRIISRIHRFASR